MPQVRLTGHVDVPADAWSDVLDALPDHVALTLAEPGCLRFEVTPDPGQPHRLQVREAFRDRAAYLAHQKRSRASRWGKLTRGFPRSYQITGA
ncbi:MAG TPA: antibiotic biosynthesis monooxygenase [Aliiroseovarius sp.]|nr:antibiotic biosynthesis monooxygenase [Aliiroseovarius sp.]